MPEQEITVKVDVPEGWEIDGDPKSKAIFDLGNTVRYELFVMYKRLPPHQWPECFPEGCWVFEHVNTQWRVSMVKPCPATGFCAEGLRASPSIDAIAFASFHGQTFTPPPNTRCVQVRRT